MLPLIVSLIAAVLTYATATPAAAQGVTTYVATLAETNDCPDGQVRVLVPYESSPFYNPDVVFKQAPAPVSACAELRGLPASALKGRFVRLTYEDGKFMVVPPVRVH